LGFPTGSTGPVGEADALWDTVGEADWSVPESEPEQPAAVARTRIPAVMNATRIALPASVVLLSSLTRYPTSPTDARDRPRSGR